ncbi:heterokaryon incompatibility protein-domain-containing protein [Pestalotiopsis sp. NC0098]|nr:heterokaryon incompatibility protein-domain-containing protein [Pestalotiopsis sp. NC0098]
MRVINTRTLELHESADRPYAILSHTWAEEEVTIQQYREWRSAHAEYFAKNVGAVTDGSVEPAEITMLKRIKRGDKPAESERAHHQGMTKILRCAERALSDGYEYIWVDTCCIDKTSSAELQEAINSMFKWYEKAGVCYAYLSDVDSSTPGRGVLTSSRWFSRGWTLQELLAPREVLFFDMNWKKLGPKYGLLDLLAKKTGIDSYFLYTGAERLGEASVATRMSWAAGRETKRLEDRAYCLLGLFGIHMPMLYGEGALAFERLQLEIMKSSNDASILAWDYSGTWIPVSHDRSARFERTGKYTNKTSACKPIQ